MTAVRAPNDLVSRSVQRGASARTAGGARRAARHAQKRAHASTTPPRKKSTTITKATPSRSGQRAHTALTDSDSQMNTKEPMTGP